MMDLPRLPGDASASAGPPPAQKGKAGAKAGVGAAPPLKACNLVGAALDLQLLRDDNKAELVEILDALAGTKCLVLDASLGSRLNHVLVEGAKILRDNGVVHFRELRSELGDFEAGAEPDHVVYVVRATVAHAHAVAQHVKAALRRGECGGAGRPLRHHVYMVPRKTLVCEQILEDEGVLPYVSVGEFHLDLVALDKDVLSMDLDNCFCDLKVHGDNTTREAAPRRQPRSTAWLEFVVQSILKLEHFFGVPETVRALGPAAAGVAERLARAHAKAAAAKRRGRGRAGAANGPFGSVAPQDEADEEDEAWSKRCISALVLIDREVDLVTPMVTPLTYEGLLDELLGGIKNACVRVSREIIGAEDDASKKPAKDDLEGLRTPLTTPNESFSVTLNSNDKLYAEVRDLNVEHLGTHLGERAKQIRGSYDSFRSKKDASITDIHDFVKSIPGLTQNYKSLQTHINLTEAVNKTTHSRDFRARWHTERSLLEGDAAYEALEDLVATQEPPMFFLRMLCLQSLTAGGLRTAKYDGFRRQVLHTYGFELVGTLHQLEKVGLLRHRRDGVSALLGGDANASPFNSLRKALRLIVDDVDPHEPGDIAYVSSGYAPLAARLIELMGRAHGWHGIASALPLLPGPALEYSPRDYDRDALAALLRQQSAKLHYSPAHAAKPPAARNGGAKPVMLVYYVGGVTYAEIAAFRFLSLQPAFPYQIVVATTNIVNGTQLIKSLVYDIENKLQR